MKKIEYSKPEIEVRILNLENIMGATGSVDGETIGYGGEDDGTHDPGAKDFWDDEEDY